MGVTACGFQSVVCERKKIGCGCHSLSACGREARVGAYSVTPYLRLSFYVRLPLRWPHDAGFSPKSTRVGAIVTLSNFKGAITLISRTFDIFQLATAGVRLFFYYFLTLSVITFLSPS